jgi:D-glycero-alpha-D-manno-heptose-7-phosphate kinase
MIIRSKAPFRLGLAGGGTDVSPYSDNYGGAILNATINLYAHATIIPRKDNKIILNAQNVQESENHDLINELPIDGQLDLQKGVINRIFRSYGIPNTGFELITASDVPSGSGLGTSSTLVVAILGAFVEWMKLPLGKYDIAQLAYDIEREDLKMAGGKQDQYAATFGGVNFMEFLADNKVVVNPLSLKKKWLNELELRMVLYYTKTSRESAKIIEVQADNVAQKKNKPIQAMHELKAQAFDMKTALLRGKLNEIGDILNKSWHHKKAMAEGISNEEIDTIYKKAIEAGATGGKMSGAGGGGFMIFFVPWDKQALLIDSLKQMGGSCYRFEFCRKGLTTWSIKE